MKHYEILVKDPIIAKHLPETHWYGYSTLRSMLNKYSMLYLKPNNNSSGNGIIRIKLIGKDYYQVSFENTTIDVAKINLVTTLKKIIKGTPNYIIQQGIDLATYKNNPFDMRIVLQKVLKTWRITLNSAKVASAEDAIVTNVAKGAKDYLLQQILYDYDQKIDPMATFREILDLSHQIANVLGEQLPILIIGLDLAVDKQGKIWFIESNERPDCIRCKIVNDKLSVEKYEQARNLIRISKRQIK